MFATQETAAPLIDTDTPDTFVTGIARVEHIPGGCLRFVIYVDQTDQDGKMERVVVSRIVIPTANVPYCCRQTATALATTGLRLLPARSGPLN